MRFIKDKEMHLDLKKYLGAFPFVLDELKDIDEGWRNGTILETCIAAYCFHAVKTNTPLNNPTNIFEAITVYNCTKLKNEALQYLIKYDCVELFNSDKLKLHAFFPGPMFSTGGKPFYPREWHFNCLDCRKHITSSQTALGNFGSFNDNKLDLKAVDDGRNGKRIGFEIDGTSFVFTTTRDSEGFVDSKTGEKFPFEDFARFSTLKPLTIPRFDNVKINEFAL